MKRTRLIATFLALILCLTTLPGLAVASAAAPPAAAPSAVGGDTASPQAEVTEWYYRVYNGYLQRRLWSVSYQCWLTDWEYIH